MLCSAAMYCGLVVGGMTYHFTEKYAPENGYTWNNQVLGLEIEQSKEGFYYGGHVSRFNDSYNKSSDTQLIRTGYRFNDNFAMGAGFGRTKTSYYEGAILLPYAEGCAKSLCANVFVLPDVGANDAIVNVSFKVRF